MSTLAQESTHWYLSEDCEHGKRGDPFYQFAGKNGNVRSPNLGDLKRGLPIVPGYSTIAACARQPGLDAWKSRQLVNSVLKLPRHDGESLDDFAARAIEDSKEQGKKAAERGTSLHAAIEEYAATGQRSLEWGAHVDAVCRALYEYSIDIATGSTEHSFVSDLGYGGKVDWHQGKEDFDSDIRTVLDFKSKDRIVDEAKLTYDEHPMQLGAYGNGIFGDHAFRGFNVFVGVEDTRVVVVEHSWDDLQRGFQCFCALLAYWKLKSRI